MKLKRIFLADLKMKKNLRLDGDLMKFLILGASSGCADNVWITKDASGHLSLAANEAAAITAWTELSAAPMMFFATVCLL